MYGAIVQGPVRPVRREAQVPDAAPDRRAEDRCRAHERGAIADLCQRPGPTQGVERRKLGAHIKTEGARSPVEKVQQAEDVRGGRVVPVRNVRGGLERRLTEPVGGVRERLAERRRRKVQARHREVRGPERAREVVGRG